MTTKASLTHAEYFIEIPIAAPPETVWRCLTEEIDAWWLPDFRLVGAGSRVTLDARAGGQLLEQLEGGGSLLWYTVAMCTPGRSLDLVGHLSPDYGGPATSMLKLELEAAGRDRGATLLKVRDALVGHLSPTLARTMRDGWTQLFTDGLAAHAASG